VLHLGEFKAGDSFGISCAYEDSLVGVTITAHVRKDGALVQVLGVSTPVSQSYELSASPASTSAWPLGFLECDIRYSSGGNVSRTETFTLEVVRGVTQ
jgi:hypothetical protein